MKRRLANSAELVIPLLYLLILSFNCLSQPGEPRFHRISVEEGLSQSTVNCILQDRRGFLWIGTDDGLNRYDGKEFKIFRKDPTNRKSLQDNRIKKLYQDSSGTLWIGTTTGGLHRYNPGLENFDNWNKQPNDPNSLSSNSITALCEDPDGLLWIGTSGGGLDILKPESGEIVHYRHQSQQLESLSDDQVRALYCDVQGNLWVGTDSGLDLFDRERKVFIHQKLQYPADVQGGSAVGFIYGDQDGLLWLGTAAGLVRLDPSTGKSRLWQPVSSSPKSYEENRITAIAPGNQQNYWIGTLSRGLYTFDGENFTSIRLGEGNGSVHTGQPGVSCIYRDKAGIVWVGTYNGVYKILSRGFKFHDWTQEIGADRLTSNYIWPIYEDHEGVIWIGTIAGLNAFDPASGKITQYVHDPKNPSSLSNNAVISIFEDRQGNLWMGTFTGGLNRFNRKTSTFEHWQHHPDNPESLPHNLVGCIYQDRAGRLWIGTAKGLANFDVRENRPKRYKGTDYNPNDIYIHDILEDQKGDFWIATAKSGLFRFNPQQGITGHWQHDPENPNSISANAVTEIISLPQTSDSSQFRLWLGTEGGGVNVFDPQSETFRAFTVAEGLADNSISMMVADDAGNIWISTENGLTCLNPRNGILQTFDQRDGISNPQFNPWAGMKSRSGRLYFGTSTGMIYFDPQELNNDITQPPPRVVLTGLEIFNQPVSIGHGSPLKVSISETQTLRLSYREFLFSLKFAALDFYKPNQNRYAYKMEGLHDAWIDIGTRHRVDFTGLSPGEYIFRVKASNSRGIWNEEGARLRIVITPPYWQTWWFRMLVLITVIGLLYSFYRMRLQRLLEVERTRTRIARDLHDEVSATLSGISWFARAAEAEKKAGGKGEDYNKKIIESAAEAQDKIKDIIWAIQPEHDKWEQLFAHCQRFAADLLESNRIKPEMHFQPPPGSRNVDMNTRQNFWLMFKEILVNAIKHSHCETVKISIIATGRTIHLEISDDGVGFDITQKSKGNGLANIRTRAEALGADYQLKSKPGEGTHWEVQFAMK